LAHGRAVRRRLFLLLRQRLRLLLVHRIELLLRLLQWAFNGLCHVGHGAACRRVGRILSLHDEEQCPA
jgi:hypothetical protein